MAKRFFKKSEPVVKVARKSISASPYQQAVFDYCIDMLENDNPNLIINACAGSGKTTTLVETLYRIKDSNPFVKCLFLAFNKKIQLELESRIPTGVVAKTTHSLGLSTLGKVNVDNWKVPNILKEMLNIKDNKTLTNPDEIKANNRLIFISIFAKRMISILKNLNVSPSEVEIEKLFEVADFYSIDDFEIDEEMTYIIQQAFIRSCADTSIVDFDDMLYFPAQNKLAPER